MISISTKLLIGFLLIVGSIACYFIFFFSPTLTMQIGPASELKIEILEGWEIQSQWIGGSEKRDVTIINDRTGQAIVVRDGKLFMREKERKEWLYYGEVILGYEFSLNEEDLKPEQMKVKKNSTMAELSG